MQLTKNVCSQLTSDIKSILYSSRDHTKAKGSPLQHEHNIFVFSLRPQPFKLSVNQDLFSITEK